MPSQPEYPTFAPEEVAQIAEAQERVIEARRDWGTKRSALDDAKDDEKQAKGHLETQQKLLSALLEQLLHPQKEGELYALDEDLGDDPGPVVPPPNAAEGWRQVSLPQLKLPYHICSALEQSNIFTMGQIADWTRDGKKQLTDIVGIGPKSAEKISDACIAWFAANRPPAKDEPAKDEPPAEGDQNAA